MRTKIANCLKLWDPEGALSLVFRRKGIANLVCKEYIILANGDFKDDDLTAKAIIVTGNIFARSIECDYVIAGGNICVEKSMKCREIYAKGNISVCTEEEDENVGWYYYGSIECDEITAHDIETECLHCRGDIYCSSLDVKYEGKVHAIYAKEKIVVGKDYEGTNITGARLFCEYQLNAPEIYVAGDLTASRSSVFADKLYVAGIWKEV